MINSVLLVTLGDPNGIGPEVSAKTVKPFSARCPVVLIGPSEALTPWKKFLGRLPARISAFALAAMAKHGLLAPGLYLIEPEDTGWLDFCPGKITKPAAIASFRSLEIAARLLKLDPARFRLVTAPLSKEAILRAGIPFTGHTGYLGQVFRGRPLMLLMSGRLRVGLVTEHIPLAQVSKRITRSNVLWSLRTLAVGLRRMGFGKPKIAALGLNPHAGEGGKIGREDLVIGSAVRAFNRLNIGRAAGPVPADSAFAHPDRVDAFLAMYHDQGLIAVKMGGIRDVINITLGLPIRRASPAHGTAYDIAGRGVADPRSMRAALAWALQLKPPGRM